MAKLKTSEKRLLLMFGVVAFVLLNLFAWNVYSKKKNLVLFEINDSKNKINSFRFLLPEKEMWEKRRAWLAARMPAYTTEEAEAPKLEGSVTNSAGLAGVTIGKIIPIEHSATAEYQKIGVGVTAFGSNEEIIRFLSLLQSRDAFRLMPTVKITPDKKDPSIVNVELTLNQLYSLETVAVPEPETQPESENPPVSGEPNVVKSESAPVTPQPVVTQ